MPKKVNSQPQHEESPELGPDYYEVQSIMDKRTTSKGDQYFIKWKNFPNPQDFTWEPIEHLQEVQELIEAFNQALAGKMKKKDILKKKEEEKEKEFQPEPQEEEPEPEPEAEEAPKKKRGRKKGQTVKKMEGEGKYLPKIVNTEHPQPRKRQKTAKRPESSDQDLPPQKRKIKQDQGLPKGVIILNSQQSSPPTSERWFNRPPFRLGSIFSHSFSGPTLTFTLNVQTTSGELVCLTELPEYQIQRTDRQKVKSYMLSYFFSLSKQMSENQLVEIWGE